MKKLAILGGKPVRKKQFIVEPKINKEEFRLVNKAMKDVNFSRYVGSNNVNLKKHLKLTSIEAIKIKDKWNFLGGPNIRKFCYDFSKKFNTPYSIPVNSATSALSVALASLNIGPGDEVIVPSISWTSSSTSILLFNSIPRFVDIEEKTFCIDADKIEKSINKRTKAILVVHLAGNIANMNKIMQIAKKHKLFVVEDVAQAPGCRLNGKLAGTIGDIGVFSFQQSKNIMTGEGGMIITKSVKVAEKARLIINHGEVYFDERSKIKDMINVIGQNFRMTEISAALGIAQLKKLDFVNKWRLKNYNFLRKELSKIEGFSFAEINKGHLRNAQIFPHMFVILYNEKKVGIKRDIFLKVLNSEGITAGSGYQRPMYLNPIFTKKIAYGSKGYPWTHHGFKAKNYYVKKLCPVGEILLSKKKIFMYQIAYSSNINDMKDIIKAVNKIILNKAKINSFFSKKKSLFINQGRILN